MDREDAIPPQRQGRIPKSPTLLFLSTPYAKVRILSQCPEW
jgi:hypothetical protein